MLDIEFREIADKAAAISNVIKYNDALSSIKSFDKKVHDDIVRTISMARAWYAIHHEGKWLLGPAKFIGFSGMTPQIYSANRTIISGTRGDWAVRQYLPDSKPVSKNHPAWLALTELAKRFEVRGPNAKAYVTVLHEEKEEIPKTAEKPIQIIEAMAVDAVIALAAAMSSEARDLLKKRVLTL